MRKSQTNVTKDYNVVKQEIEDLLKVKYIFNNELTESIFVANTEYTVPL